MALDLEQYEGCLCEVKTMQNDVIATGLINYADGEGIELVGMGGEKLPILRYNLPVKVSIMSEKHGFLVLVGTVYISSDWLLKVSDLDELQTYERRAFFRLNVDKHATVTKLSGADGEVVSAEPIQVKLKDVSLGGCMIETDADVKPGETYLVQFTLLAARHEMRCAVCRMVGGHDNLLEHKNYGCSFEGNTERQQDAICRDLFQLQRIEIQKRRKNNF